MTPAEACTWAAAGKIIPGAAAPLQGDSPCRPPAPPATRPWRVGAGPPTPLRQAGEAAGASAGFQERGDGGGDPQPRSLQRRPSCLTHPLSLVLVAMAPSGPGPLSFCLWSPVCLSLRLCPSVQSCLFACHRHSLTFSVCLFFQPHHPSSSACPSSVCSSCPSVHLPLTWMGLSTGP